MPARPSIPLLLDLLRTAMRKQASALYIVPWLPPTLRIDEQTVPLSSASFKPEQSSRLVLDLLDEAHRAALDRSREIEFSFELEGLGRFRVTAFRRHGQPAMAIRPYAVQPPTPRTLALPAAAAQAALADHGLLVLVSRSAALRRDCTAALIEHRNRNGQGELALLEDATRHWHEGLRCTLRQGLTGAAVDELLLRRGARLAPGAPPHGPLAIAWGELRDGPQLERAVRAADRALSLVALDADDLAGALLRLEGLAIEQGGIDLRHRTALALNGLLLLRPVRPLQGERELAATALLMNSPELAADLAEGDLQALHAMLSAPGSAAAAGIDPHLAQLVAQGLVGVDEALRHAVDRAALARRLSAAAAPPAVEAPAAKVRVDTGFADLIDPALPVADPFDFAEPGRRRPVATDTQFDRVDWSAAPAAPARTERPPLPGSAQFHAWATPALAPGGTLVVDLWVALPAQAAQVEALARQVDGPPQPAAPPDDGVPLVTAQLRIDGLLPAVPSQRLRWAGRPARVRFSVAVPPRTPIGAYAARIRLTVGGLPIGELGFVLEVLPDAALDAALQDTHAVRRMVQTAYASYAPADRAEVLACVQALHPVAPGLAVFVDAPRLRSQEHWRERIAREVGRCERLFLFWSAAAAESPWVDYEWRLALRHGDAAQIDAVLLEPPRLAPLPAELSDLVSAELRLRRSASG